MFCLGNRTAMCPTAGCMDAEVANRNALCTELTAVFPNPPSPSHPRHAPPLALGNQNLAAEGQQGGMGGDWAERLKENAPQPPPLKVAMASNRMLCMPK